MTTLFRKLLEDTKLKDKVNVGLGVNLGGPTSKGELVPPKPKKKHSIGLKNNLNLKQASADATRERTANVGMSPEIADAFANMNTDDVDLSNEISDEQAAANAGLTRRSFDIIPRTPNLLPKVMSNALTSDVDVEWHMVKNLPGYLSAPIRAIGRQVFSPFTKTPIEDIQVLANLQDSGPNSQSEIDTVSKFVTSTGIRNSDAELHFQKVFPGYRADIVSYDCQGYTFLFVKDFAGNYIYVWPSSDSNTIGNLGANGQLSSPTKQLPYR